MTTQSTARKSTPAKSAAPTPEKVEEKTEVMEEKIENAEISEDTEKERIPLVLKNNPILADFCRQYLDVVDEIAKYNKVVLAEKDSEWNAGKILAKARELGRPEDANVPANTTIKTALEAYESLVNETARARKNILDLTAKEIGISAPNTEERNMETENILKERRKLASDIGTQLSAFAKMITDATASSAVNEFLESSPLPAIGRDQTRNFGTDTGKATPKYRVNITVTKDGTVVVDEAGFTKTALALPKFYERGKSPKADVLREAWEKAGNSADATVTNPVEFDDNGLHFKILKK